MSQTLPRQFTMVAAPNVLSAIGEVLRMAFNRPASIEMFERLLAKLERH